MSASLTQRREVFTIILRSDTINICEMVLLNRIASPRSPILRRGHVATCHVPPYYFLSATRAAILDPDLYPEGSIARNDIFQKIQDFRKDTYNCFWPTAPPNAKCSWVSCAEAAPDVAMLSSNTHCISASIRTTDLYFLDRTPFPELPLGQLQRLFWTSKSFSPLPISTYDSSKTSAKSSLLSPGYSKREFNSAEINRQITHSNP